MEGNVPLCVALAWILVRDEDFADYMFQLPCPNVEAEYTRYRQNHEMILGTRTASLERAWDLLRGFAEQDHITIYGEAFEKSPHITKFEIGIHGIDEQVVNPGAPPLPIRKYGRSGVDRLSGLKLVRTRIDEVSERLVLKPPAWLSNGGFWFQNVEMEWERIRELFPLVSSEPDNGTEVRTTPSDSDTQKLTVGETNDENVASHDPTKHGEGIPTVISGKDLRRRYIREAYQALLDEGKLPDRIEDRYDAINAWISTNHNVHPVSASTIVRALKPDE